MIHREREINAERDEHRKTDKYIGGREIYRKSKRDKRSRQRETEKVRKRKR